MSYICGLRIYRDERQARHIAPSNLQSDDKQDKCIYIYEKTPTFKVYILHFRLLYY